MARFSDRVGLTKANAILQTDSVSDDLRNSLWNALTIALDDFQIMFDRFGNRTSANLFAMHLWMNFFKKPLDEMPQDWGRVKQVLKNAYTQGEWFQVYNLIEAVIESLAALTYDNPQHRLNTFRNLSNLYLEREMAGYRLIGSHVVPITSEAEIQSLSEALALEDRFGNYLVDVARKAA